MTPSLKKLKASRRPTLWYNEKNDELIIALASYRWVRCSERHQEWYQCFVYTENLKQFAHKHWEFVSWL